MRDQMAPTVLAPASVRPACHVRVSCDSDVHFGNWRPAVAGLRKLLAGGAWRTHPFPSLLVPALHGAVLEHLAQVRMRGERERIRARAPDLALRVRVLPLSSS